MPTLNARKPKSLSIIKQTLENLEKDQSYQLQVTSPKLREGY